MALLVPLPLTVSCFSKIQTGVTFLLPAADLGNPGKRAVKRVWCVCVWARCCHAAPVIVVAPEDQKVAQSGIANFYCRATGIPPPSIEWRKAGQRIGRHHKRYLLVDAGRGHDDGAESGGAAAAVLRIEPVRARRDDDTYECRADNGVGTAALARARLDVYADQHAGMITT